MKIFYVSPDVFPFSQSSNLADAASAFPKYLKSQGHDIRVMMPNYRTVNERKYILRDVIRLQGLQIKVGDDVFEANSKSAFLPSSKVQIYFLNNRKLFDSEGNFNDITVGKKYRDNAKRFIFFAKGCLETLKLLYWQPDIIHCNDWQTALIPMLLKTSYGDDPFFKNTKTLLSVHNLSRLGLFDASVANLIGIPGSSFNSTGPIINDQLFSFLGSGLEYADLLNISTACSDSINYANFPISLDKIKTIQYGIDTVVWNPESDKLIPAQYSKSDLSGKLTNKHELKSYFGFKEIDDLPIISMNINSAAGNKIKILLNAIEELLALNLYLIFTGAPDAKYRKKLEAFQSEHQDRIGIEWKYDHKLAHLIKAGSDFSIVPSVTEPFGIRQLNNQVYGTIPIVFYAEGIQLTEQFDAGTGTGFLCQKPSVKELVATVGSAISVYKNKDSWPTLLNNAMSQELSWDEPGQEYVNLYGKLMNNKSSRKR